MKEGDWYIDISGDLCQVLDPIPDYEGKVAVKVAWRKGLGNMPISKYMTYTEFLKTPIDESLVKLILSS